jgi:predicted nuclease with TOPRIM domain
MRVTMQELRKIKAFETEMTLLDYNKVCKFYRKGDGTLEEYQNFLDIVEQYQEVKNKVISTIGNKERLKEFLTLLEEKSIQCHYKTVNCLEMYEFIYLSLELLDSFKKCNREVSGQQRVNLHKMLVSKIETN